MYYYSRNVSPRKVVKLPCFNFDFQDSPPMLVSIGVGFWWEHLGSSPHSSENKNAWILVSLITLVDSSGSNLSGSLCRVWQLFLFFTRMKTFWSFDYQLSHELALSPFLNCFNQTHKICLIVRWIDFCSLKVGAWRYIWWWWFDAMACKDEVWSRASQCCRLLLILKGLIPVR